MNDTTLETTINQLLTPPRRVSHLRAARLLLRDLIILDPNIMRYTLPIAAALVRKSNWMTRVSASKIHAYVAKRVPVCEMLAIFVVDSFDPEVEYMCAMVEALYSPEDFTDQLVAEALEDDSAPSHDLSD